MTVCIYSAETRLDAVHAKARVRTRFPDVVLTVEPQPLDRWGVFAPKAADVLALSEAALSPTEHAVWRGE